jgi:hypothetical protein
MKPELIILGITVFLIFNTYHDGKYTKMLTFARKYLKMGIIAFVGLSIYLYIKKKPSESQTFLKHANNIIRYMPIDRETTNILKPVIDLTGGLHTEQIKKTGQSPQIKRIINSGRTSTKRSVSETKKKYVASQQDWKCKHCQNQLDATFEVDHVIDLQYGGSNHVDNLVALCRNCHGKKTLLSHL